MNFSEFVLSLLTLLTKTLMQMKALKIIILIIVAIVVLLLIVGLFLPKNVHTESSISIDAPAKVIFKQVNHLKSWDNWSPFLEDDPNMVTTYEGPEEGVGAKSLWDMEDGSGNLTIVESIPYEKISTDLVFNGEGEASGSFLFKEMDEGIKVIWTFDMDNLAYPFEVYMGCVMDVMMKQYLEKGLLNLKEYCENLPDIDMEVEITETFVEPQLSLAIKDSVDMYHIGDKMLELYTELESYMLEAGIEISGPPYAVYYNWDTAALIVFEAGFPVLAKVEGKDRMFFTETPGGNVVTAYNYGNYNSIGEIHTKIHEYINKNAIVMMGYPWEVYLTDPNSEPDTSKWVTQILYPVE